jgi:putative membrane protein
MADHPYTRFRQEDLILRDELAIDRTILANERTVLAYFRSALTLIIAGVTFLHFVQEGTLRYLGILFVPFGLAVGVFGAIRYRRMDAAIRLVRQSLDREDAQGPQGAAAASPTRDRSV